MTVQKIILIPTTDSKFTSWARLEPSSDKNLYLCYLYLFNLYLYNTLIYLSIICLFLNEKLSDLLIDKSNERN